MLNPAQQARAQRIKHITKVLSKYDGEGVRLEKFEAQLMITFGFTKPKVREYVNALIASDTVDVIDGKIKINGGSIK